MPPHNDPFTDPSFSDRASADPLALERSLDELHALSEEELRELILCCEAAAAEGEAGTNLLELLSRCRQELSRRAWN